MQQPAWINLRCTMLSQRSRLKGLILRDSVFRASQTGKSIGAEGGCHIQEAEGGDGHKRHKGLGLEETLLCPDCGGYKTMCIRQHSELILAR